jgi:uncharacterized protein YdhG (YjbR/CyaY superfamily)
MKKPQDFAEYVSGFPPKTQKALRQLRATIRKAAPQAEEVISYGIPAFKLNGVIAYFAAYPRHVGFYPRTWATPALRKELSKYKGGKGSVRFPLEEPLPLGLIARIVKFRAAEDRKGARNKKK